jgi:hypothetical protein
MMSSTRYAKDGSPLRQERYASDPAFNEALKASAVAKRCGLFADPRHKELCLHLQHLSMQPGGLAAFAEDFLTRYGDRIGSKTMRENRGLKVFDAGLVKTIRDELGTMSALGDAFPLKGEMEAFDPFGSLLIEAAEKDVQWWTGGEYEREERARQKAAAARAPSKYAASDFIDYCMDLAVDGLEGWLTDFCLNPEANFNNSPSWFHDLGQSLTDYLNDRREDVLAGKIVTSIGEQINDALDYAWDEKCMVHINGVARMGKTFQTEQWCRCYPGRVRYVQVPSSNDDISFFRAIARALGANSGSAMSTTQIKRQVEDTIQDAGIMLIFDEAHYLWPQQKRGGSYPRRINWVLTEIVNKGIPVAIVTTPQFDVNQNLVVNNTGWAAEQLDGRIAYRLNLSATLPESDLSAVAWYNLPNAGKQIIGGLCDYAMASGKYLAGIEAVAKRSRFLAKKDGRTDLSKADIKTAMFEVDPSLSRLSKTEGETTDCKPSAKAVNRSRRGVARAVQAAEKQLVGAG